MKKLLIPLAAALLCGFLILLYPGAPESSPEVPETIPETSLETVPETTQETFPPADPDLTVHFIDVGHADSILLESAGEFLLIDGGNVDDGPLVVSYLKQMGVDHLQVVSSHAHEDHVGGLAAVLSEFDVDAVYSPVTEYTSKAFKNFLKKVQEQGLTLTIPAPGDKILLGSTSITVMGPVKEYPEEVNNTSIVLLASYRETKFLFTGDMERSAETDMLDFWGNYINWDCDVLKVGHHGASASTRHRLIYEVCPEYAVLSVGKDNPYGLPSEASLSRLQDADAALFRTDHLGHIIAHSDGEEIVFTWENQDFIPENVEPADPELQLLYGHTQSKKFHLRTCKQAPVETIRVTFSHYSDAVAEGYTPCTLCLK